MFDLSVFSPLTILKFGLIGLAPILLWVWFFQRQNPLRNRYVILTFLAGMLSVLPIKLYEKYWGHAIWYFEHVNLFEHLADLVAMPGAPKLLAFVVVSGIVAAALFLFSAVLMGVIEMISGDNSFRVFRRKVGKIFESPFLFVSMGVLFGVAGYALSSVFPSRVWFFVVVGMLEEFIKYLMLRFSNEEKIKSVSDAISYAIIIALGFAFVENILYLQKFWASSGENSSQFFLFFVLRSSFSVVAHVCFSAILGYFYGMAHFSEEMYRDKAQQRKHPLLRFMHKVLHLKSGVLFHEEKLMEGMLWAMIAHAVFNSLLEFGQVAALVPFLLILFFFILHLLHRKDTHQQWGHVLSKPFL
ncbi:MAG: PrsW family intramembrane metalloprotease [Candidatus Gracilibacteria bacterium]|nr:PrsW family intramembrane metalloprotease [Candidatus Gracilibacteria bacterium]